MNRRFASIVPALCLGGAVLFWGTSFVAVKTALDSFSPMTVSWLRMVIATVAFAPFWPRVAKPRYQRGDWKLLALTGLLMPCLYYLFESYAVRYTTSSQAGVISAIVPLLVSAGAWLFLKERVGVRAAAAIAISLGGVAVLSLGATAGGSAPNPVLGNMLELLAMVAAAGSQLVIKHLSTRYGPWLLTGMQAAVGTVFFLPGAFMSGPSAWTHATPAAWASVAYLGIVVTLGAFGLYNTALAKLPASRASLSINLVPAVALLAGWIVRGESLTAVQFAACATIVGAVVWGESGPGAHALALPAEAAADAGLPEAE
jgi:drug/metabolite transporter (DMT)-like permease